MSLTLRRIAPLLLFCAAGCSATSQLEANRESLQASLTAYQEGDLQRASSYMNGLLGATQARADDFTLQRFWAAWLLARTHAAASLEAPFLTEKTTGDPTLGGVGTRKKPGRRESRTAHIVASLYYATSARTIYDRAARSGPKRDGVSLLPEELWTKGVDQADTDLQVITLAQLSRLGFPERVADAVAATPELHQPQTCLSFLEENAVQRQLWPWVAAMVFDYLKSSDEVVAYRFGVMAVEGEERFGTALTPRRIELIEDWIVDGASVQFVCPETETAYIPGERRSPLSGIPHDEYIAVPRSPE